MGEKLIIKNFGPIKSVELDLGRFNVLIGEQATGKSTVAKLLAICRYFSYIIDEDSSFFSSPQLSNFSKGLSDWGLSEFVKPNSLIFYECNDYSLIAKHNEIEFPDYDPEDGTPTSFKDSVFYAALTPLSQTFKLLLDSLEKIKPKPIDFFLTVDLPDWKIPSSFLQNDVANVMNDTFFLPTERGLQSFFSLGRNPKISDALYDQLADMYDIALNFSTNTNIEPLGIIYKNEKGIGRVRGNQSNEYFSLNNAASGYQSTIPIVLAIKYYNQLKKKGKTFIIEEPELNLFPTAQQKLIQFLVSSAINYENSIFINTHSPYVLTSLNNLMYAYKVGQSYSEEVEKKIAKRYWLNPDDVSVYMMLPDGTGEDIFDKEEGLIKADKIDDVSRQLNQQFDEFLTLEYAKQ